MLEEILRHKRSEVDAAKKVWPLAEIEKVCRFLPHTRDFAGALKKGRPLAVIAELKKASPSRGVLKGDFDPRVLARTYTRGGAQALSVLTDERYFQGRPCYLQLAKEASPLPILRKDFIIDAYQIWVSRALGADALLLIVAALEEEELKEYLGLCSRLGLAALVEAHTAEEVERAVKAGATIVGINNRNLKTMQVDLQTTLNLRKLVPPGITVVSESGIKTGEDVLSLIKAGVDAVLVGEALVKATDAEGKLKELLGAGGDAFFGQG